MAKKSKAKSSKSAREKVKPERKPGPRSQVLPGMEQRKHVTLDGLCETIGEARDEINTAKVREQEAITAALQYMTKRQVHAYVHARVELGWIPGVDKIRVRMRKEDGDAEASGDDRADGPSDEQTDAVDDSND